MGCNLSILNKDPASTLLELAPQVPGAQNPIPELDRDTLLAALKDIALYIKSKGGNITIISVGGAVNTIFLRSRSSTHDIDFFNQQLTQAELKLLIAGAHHAQKRNRLLQNEWINNRTVLFIPTDRHRVLTEEAIAQHEVIFQEPGLTILAAPWLYAMCAKMHRISGGGFKKQHQPYVPADAANYLNRFLILWNQRSILESRIHQEAEKFQIRYSAEALRHVDDAYRHKWGHSVIQFGK